MFHERVAVAAAKLNINWTSVGVVADEGTSRYTKIVKWYNMKNYSWSYLHVPILKIKKCGFFKTLLCCPVFTPQITGATVFAPPTIKVSEQVPAVAAAVEGPAIVKETKSNLSYSKIEMNNLYLRIST
jgi:hypothetical protein